MNEKREKERWERERRERERGEREEEGEEEGLGGFPRFSGEEPISTAH
jgi:hypothetical protein